MKATDMLRRTIIASLPAVFTLSAQLPQQPRTEPKDDEVRLPDGKIQRDEILKSDYEKSLKDAADLEKLASELRTDLEKSTAFVVSIPTIKKTEEIEKLAKRIRGRLKRN